MNNSTRASVFYAAFVALTGQALAIAPSSNDEADFCTRLGRSIGLDEAKLADGKGKWKASPFNFGQRFLFGGSAATSVNVEPIEPTTVDDFKRAEGMCEADGKGAACRLVGPVNFTFGWKGNKTVTFVLPNETATVRVEGSKTTCQSG
ncbi:hypothetical protein [Novosphingopyxis baekryungensis]|uniref:hypothetical protein n=1 Tax=Novosphingopyxis baekryungensis TaxID=279369 RepID=UPI000A034696|nr:hypothetical protein [Novosphingopyxis baekryungensis]